MVIATLDAVAIVRKFNINFSSAYRDTHTHTHTHIHSIVTTLHDLSNSVYAVVANFLVTGLGVC